MAPRDPAHGARRRRVVIDLVPLQPGRGGAGGGIWSYARHLVLELDRLAPEDLDLVCLAHPTLPLETRHVQLVRVDADTRSVARRLAWVHGGLPLWCLRHGADVLHKLATEIPAVLPRTRLVTTVQDFMAEHYMAAHHRARGRAGRATPGRARRAYFAAMARRCFARSDRVITSSQAIAAEARERFSHAAARVVVVPHGVEHHAAAGVEPERPTGSPDAARGDRGARSGGILVVGMFARHKRQLQALRAFERLAERAPGAAARATLTFRGFAEDVDYHAEVRRAAAASAVADRIRFVDYERDLAPGDIYAAADVLLFPSQYEGFGLPVLEAQVAGVPVVCADIPVFREVAGDGAVFVPADDADAVAAALERVLTDEASRASLRRRGEANAARFSWARTALETLAVYRDVARG
jgi:glycosyltransferase involved in cell wall biosynthesis